MPDIFDELNALLEAHPEARDRMLRILGELDEEAHPHTQIIPVEFTIPPLPDTYTEIAPGTRMWIRYWREHPEEQSEMLAFAKGGK